MLAKFALNGFLCRYRRGVSGSGKRFKELVQITKFIKSIHFKIKEIQND